MPIASPGQQTGPPPGSQYADQSRSNFAYGRERLRIFDSIQESYRLCNLRFTSQTKAMITDLGDVRGRRVLEFGSGQGKFAAYLASRGVLVVGIDLGPDLIALAAKVARLNGVHCGLCVGNVRSLPFKDSQFDFVVGNGVLHHLPEEWLKEAVMEAYRVLKPAGEALFTEPVENSRVFNVLQNIIPVGWSDPTGYRPSILQRRKWARYASTVDDRSLCDREIIEAGRTFRQVKLNYYGWLIRLGRIYGHPRFVRVLESADRLLSHRYSPLKRFSQCVLVHYLK